MAERVAVTSVLELTEVNASGAKKIEINETAAGLPSMTLRPGISLKGGTLEFKARGLRLTSDNDISNLRVDTSEHEVAIYNDTSVANLGTSSLTNVPTIGQVYLVAEDQVRKRALWASMSTARFQI